LASSVSPAGAGAVSPSSGAFNNAGSTVNLVAAAAAGYQFSSWTGHVAGPKKASTTIAMSSPQSVTANFTPIPVLHAALTAKSGTAKARTWTFTFTNSGLAEATSVTIKSFTLTQTAGPACTPLLSTSMPDVVGNIAPNATLKANVVINFASCTAATRFSLSMPFAATTGAARTLTLSNQPQ
jgi:uncharacterized repeat protein (TIGR02543 family)